MNLFFHYLTKSETGDLIMTIVIATLLALVFPSLMKLSKSIDAGAVGNILKKFCNKQGFIPLKANQAEELKELVSGCFVMAGEGIVDVNVVRGFLKSSGGTDLYLSVIKRNLQLNSKSIGTQEQINYFNFFGRLDHSLPYSLIFNRKLQPIETYFLGKNLIIENPVEDFTQIFEVHSPDIRIEQLSIPAEIQKTLLSYNKNYPLVFPGTDDVSCVFINKKGISIIAPLTINEDEFMSMFELGVELTEMIKPQLNPESEA